MALRGQIVVLSSGRLQVNRDLEHRRRGRQRERQKTIVLINKTLALEVHYTLWYISLPSSAKQRREMTKFKVLWRTSNA